MKIKTKSYLVILVISLLFTALYFFVFSQLHHLDGKITRAMMASRITELFVEGQRAEEDYVRAGGEEKVKVVIDHLQQISAIAERTQTVFNLVMPATSMNEIVRLADRYKTSFGEIVRLKHDLIAKEEELTKQGVALEKTVSGVLEELKNNPRNDASVISGNDSLSSKVDKITLANKILKEGQTVIHPGTSVVQKNWNFSRNLREYLVQKWDHDALMEAASSYVNSFEEVGTLQGKLDESLVLFNQTAGQLDDIIQKTHKELEQSRDEAKSAVMMAILAAFLVCGFLGLALSFWFSYVFTGPLLRLRNAMLRIAGGDMDTALELDSRDEVGELARSFQTMQSRLKESYEDLRRTNAKLAEKSEELERSNQEFEQFAHVISHDLKEPIRTVSIFTDLLEKRLHGHLEEKETDYVQHILNGCQWMYALIDDLLSYARVGSENESAQMIDSDLALNKALENLTVEIQKNQAQISRDKLPAVFANATQLTQLFQNLIANAVKFRRAEPLKIHISAERRGPAYCFSIRDNGIGISLENAERIFVVFQRLHTRKEYPGTGIGLAVCKKIVERFHGKIWIESEPGAGSVFYFTIPSGEENL